VLDELDVLPPGDVAPPVDGDDPPPDEGFELLDVDELRSMEVVLDDGASLPPEADAPCETVPSDDSVVRSTSCAPGAASVRGAPRPNIANATTASTAADTIPSTSFRELLERALTISDTTASHPG
jgi:hypothetical protein